MNTPHYVKQSIWKCYPWWCCGGLLSWTSTSRVGSLWWWSPVLRKPGHPSVNVGLFAFFPPPSLSSFFPISFLLILPAQFQRSRDEHIQVKQPFFLLYRKWLQGIIIYWLRNRGSRGKRWRFWEREKGWDGRRHFVRWLWRKWRGRRWREKWRKRMRGRRDSRKWAESVFIIVSGWLLHNFLVVEDWSREVSWRERERGRGDVARGWTLLQRWTGTGRVQTRLGALHPARDLLE